jgi:hypothetical protein
MDDEDFDDEEEEEEETLRENPQSSRANTMST